MQLNGKEIPLVRLSWKEGRYFDLWMLVHTATGCFVGFVALSFAIPFVIAVWPVFVGLIVYEVIEDIFDVHEVIENRIFDVVFGLGGFMAAYALAYKYVFIEHNLFAAALISGVGALLLSGLGWFAWMRRTGRIPFLNHRLR